MSKFWKMTSQTVENYMKAIYHLTENEQTSVSTSSLSEALSTTAASVTDMLKKLAEKGLTEYEKYKGVKLTAEGRNLALNLIRKHRLWETFLYSKLNITWDEVHEIAEQLEHIKSDLLIEKLDELLGYPRYDPHGDPIPDTNGKFTFRLQKPLNQASIGESLKMVGVKDHKSSFLRYLDSIPLSIEHIIVIKDKIEFDQSLLVEINGATQWSLSAQAAENILVKSIG